jgi:tetratricopeptide (TPR) repeat protein
MVKCMVLVMLVALPAYADDNDEATRLFEQGRTQRAQGDLDAACASFGESYAIERAAGTALNLADCEARAGNWEYALALYVGAATVFERDGRVESARFARARAEALRAQHATKPRDEPSVTTAEPTSKTWLLGVGIGGIAVSAIGTVGIIHAFGTVNDFSNANVAGEMFPGGQTRITDDDCGKVEFMSPSLQASFEDSCAAKSRVRWLLPVTFVSGVVGVTAVAYYLYTRKKQRSTMAIVPTAQGGVLATFEW